MNRMRGALVAATILMGITAAAASAMHFSAWSTAQKIDEIAGNHADLNTASLDGCPIQSPDGLSLYMASNRPGGKGGLDIWVATRAKQERPVGRAAEPSRADQLDVGRLLPDAASRRRPALREQARRGGRHLRAGRHLLRARRTRLTAGASPSTWPARRTGRTATSTSRGPRTCTGGCTSRARPCLPGNTGELYVSGKTGDMTFGPATAIAELNDAGANDIQPNVRKDGREIVFSSNRSGGAGRPGHLDGDARQRGRPLVGAGQPRRET